MFNDSNLTRDHKKSGLKSWIVLSFFLVLYLVVAYYLVFHLHFVYGDAVSRTEKAFLVLYDNTPKIASIGFIWTPLPSLLQIPLVSIKPLALYGFSGNILSAVFGALSCLYVFKFFEKTSLNWLSKSIFLLSYGLNPMILLYASNGMSESIFIFFIILSAWHYVEWSEKGEPKDTILLGVALSFAFLTRYEAVPFAVTIGALMVLSHFFRVPRPNIRKTEGDVIACFAPFVFTMVIWLMANWLIMGNPFHFLNGQYSSTEQYQLVGSELTAISGHFIDTIYYAGVRVWYVFPVSMAVFALALFVGVRKRVWILISTSLVTLSILAFHCLLLYKGNSYGWLRFFIYQIPFSFILLSIALRYIRSSVALTVITLVLFIASSMFTMYPMKSDEYGLEEHGVVNAIYSSVPLANKFTYASDKEVASYIKEKVSQKRILIDDFTGYGIVLNSLDPKMFINNADADFRAVVANPKQNADYILARKPDGIGKLDEINKIYPDIYEKGSDYLVLEKDFGIWRLYKVIE